MNVSVRSMVPNDAEAVEAVEKASFPVPWSRESFWREAANENTCYLLALDGESVIGYVGCWILSGEAQVTNIALLPDYRGKGVGTMLFGAVIEVAKERGATAMTLEVRPSNTAARALYAHYGFCEVGVRKGYYRDNGEDAIILWKTSL